MEKKQRKRKMEKKLYKEERKREKRKNIFFYFLSNIHFFFNSIQNKVRTFLTSHVTTFYKIAYNNMKVSFWHLLCIEPRIEGLKNKMKNWQKKRFHWTLKRNSFTIITSATNINFQCGKKEETFYCPIFISHIYFV